MNGVVNNLDLLKDTNQHLVFETEKARMDTAKLIRSLFNLTTVGLVRIEYLTQKRYDRELVGNLIAMMAQNNHNLQEEVKRLKSEMFCMFLKNKELEEESSGLADENTALREENETMKKTLDSCGISTAMKNCGVLKQAMKLISDESAFDKLEAAVACFSSDPDPEPAVKANHDISQFQLKDYCSEERNEQSESPTSCTFETSCSSKKLKVEHPDPRSLPPPFLTNIPEVQIYHNFLTQQQLYRQNLLEKTALMD